MARIGKSASLAGTKPTGNYERILNQIDDVSRDPQNEKSRLFDFHDQQNNPIKQTHGQELFGDG